MGAWDAQGPLLYLRVALLFFFFFLGGGVGGGGDGLVGGRLGGRGLGLGRDWDLGYWDRGSRGAFSNQDQEFMI